MKQFLLYGHKHTGGGFGGYVVYCLVVFAASLFETPCRYAPQPLKVRWYWKSNLILNTNFLKHRPVPLSYTYNPQTKRLAHECENPGAPCSRAGSCIWFNPIFLTLTIMNTTSDITIPVFLFTLNNNIYDCFHNLVSLTL